MSCCCISRRACSETGRAAWPICLSLPIWVSGARVAIDTAALALADVSSGDSIAVDGVCLTAVRLQPSGFEADVSQETLNCTTGFAAGAKVNLEKSLRLADRLGGHLVSGHVDGVGTVSRFEASGDN